MRYATLAHWAAVKRYLFAATAMLTVMSPSHGLAQNIETDTVSCYPNYRELRELSGEGEVEAWANARIEAIERWAQEHKQVALEY